MCNETELVPIPDFLMSDQVKDGLLSAHPEYGHDADGVACFAMDKCIVPAVKALWAQGIRTIGCCCGHGSGHGVISLETVAGQAKPQSMRVLLLRLRQWDVIASGGGDGPYWQREIDAALELDGPSS